jgi:hypothetical protein
VSVWLGGAERFSWRVIFRCRCPGELRGVSGERFSQVSVAAAAWKAGVRKIV